MVTVTQLDKTTTAINTGKTVLLLTDRDGDGRVDSIAAADQQHQRFVFGQMGGTKVILTGGDGDPHMFNNVVANAALDTLTGGTNSVLADARDGKIDDLAQLTSVIQQVTAGGVRHDIMDLQADHTIENGGDTAAVDVEALNDKVAFTEKVVLNGKYTIGNIWDRTGNDGDIRVGLAVAGEGGQSKGTFTVIDDKTWGHADSTRVFGAAYGSVGKYVLDVAGNFNAQHGAAGKFMDKFEDYAATGFFLTAFGKKRKDESVEPTATNATATSDNTVTASVTK